MKAGADNRHPFSLERGDRMWAILLIPLILGSATASNPNFSSSCPPKYFYMENRCIRPYTLHTADYLEIIMEYAQRACDEDGAHLPIIRNDEENDSFNRIAQAFLEPRGMPILMVLGIACNNETEYTEWLDGTPIDYIPPGSDPAYYNCTESNSIPVSRVADNRWERLLGGDLMFFTSLCILEEKEDPTQEPTEEPDNRCGDYDRMEDSFAEETPCFKVFIEPQTWEIAQKQCSADFGSLIAINSPEENEFFFNTAISYNFTEGMHIGAHQSPDDTSKWTWIDGEVPITSKSFSNFIRSFPIPAVGECSSMATESEAAVWVNVDCTETKLPFICQRRDSSVVPSSCPNSEPKSGEEIISPNYPKSDVVCEYFLTVGADKLVELEILSLVSERHIDYLEIFEGAAGPGLIANLTGTLLKPTKFTTTKSNVLRVNWKPSGSEENRGFRIRYTEVEKAVPVEEVTTPFAGNVPTTTSSAVTHTLNSLIVALMFCFML